MAGQAQRIVSDSPLKRPRRFVFVLLDRFTLLCFTAAVEALRIANRMAGETIYEWDISASNAEPVACSAGIEIVPTRDLEEVSREDTILICGGIDVQDQCKDYRSCYANDSHP